MYEVYSYIDAVGFTASNSPERTQAIEDAEDQILYSDLTEEEKNSALRELSNYR